VFSGRRTAAYGGSEISVSPARISSEACRWSKNIYNSSITWDDEIATWTYEKKEKDLKLKMRKQKAWSCVHHPTTEKNQGQILVHLLEK